MRYADKGCNQCSFLKTVLLHPEDSMWLSEWTIDQELNISLGEARVGENVSPKVLNQCELDFGTEQSPRDWYAEMDLFTDVDNQAAHLITARPLQPKVNSPEAYSQVKQWLSRCPPTMTVLSSQSASQKRCLAYNSDRINSSRLSRDTSASVLAGHGGRVSYLVLLLGTSTKLHLNHR